MVKMTGVGICMIQSRDLIGRRSDLEYYVKRHRAVLELEQYRVPFSRTEDGKIYQRPFGGMTKNYGNETVQRTCAAADELTCNSSYFYGQALKHNRILYRYFALDLLMKDGQCKGLIAWNLNDGTLHRFRSHITIIAAKIWESLYSFIHLHTCTGDGNAWC